MKQKWTYVPGRRGVGGGDTETKIFIKSDFNVL